MSDLKTDANANDSRVLEFSFVCIAARIVSAVPVPLASRRAAVPSGTGGWTPAHAGRRRRVAVGAIVGLHVLIGWVLLQARAAREAVQSVAPVIVSVVESRTAAPPTPAPPLAVPPPPRPTAAPLPVPEVMVAPSPVPPNPAAITVAVAPPPPVPVTAVAPAVVPAAVAAPVVVAPGPRQIPSSAVQYLVPPPLEYPRASRREREEGEVLVRVLIDEGGLPRQVEVARSSGFPRLDAAAVTAARKAKFKPHIDAGRAVEAWATISLTFALEAG
ncbi:MAG: energy transducer TonB [Rubrivivax sp.]